MIRTAAHVAELTRLPPGLEPEAHLAAAAYLLHQSGDTALLVTEEEPSSRPATLITASDISRAVARGQDPERTRVSELATTHPGTVDAALPPDLAARLMLSAGVEHLVVRSGDRVLGIVDLASVCRWLLSLLSTPASPRERTVPARQGRTPAPPEPTHAA